MIRKLRQHLKRGVLSPQQPSVLGQMNTWQCFLLTAHVVDQPWYLNYHLLLVHLLLLLARLKNVSSIKSPKRKKRNIHKQYLTALIHGWIAADRLSKSLPPWARHWTFGSLTFISLPKDTRDSFSSPVELLWFDDTWAWRQGWSLAFRTWL